ncbi:hypothetical protein EAH78_31525 [Pseudomonas arsenicoxydans]|uniref:Uncharacterized protein n=2 Tax=Pseudomonas arsenicoxydans TaxID=702115 RepID=A0A502GTJ4_9PSED|nr:hypothetical protein EAH78_31525 [Pseudomonas arsenicoxydans]
MCIVCQNTFTEVQLYKEYNYHSLLNQYTDRQGYQRCPERYGANAICAEGVDFTDHGFFAVLFFEDSKLAQVTLASRYDPDALAKIKSSLRHSFTMLLMTGSDSNLDLVNLQQKMKSDEEFTAALMDYELKELASGHLAYAYVEGINIGSGSVDAITASHRAHENDRQIEMVVSSGLLDLAFFLPKLDQKTDNP